MIFKGLRIGGVASGLVASALLVGGCWGEKETPRLPANAFLAAYTTDATRDAPVMKAFERVFREKRGILSELMKALTPASLEQPAEDPFKTYLAIDRQQLDWSLATMGELTRPEAGKEPDFPDTTWTLCGSFNQERVIETLTQQIQKAPSGLKLEASTRRGMTVWMLKGAALDKVRGLTPCMAFSGKRLMLVGSNEKALENLLDVYAGEGAVLPENAPLSRVLEPDPHMILRVMLVNLDAVMNTVTTEAERKERMADPKVNAVVNSLREATVEMRLVPGQDAAEVAIRMECSDEANAQALSELCITAKTSAAFLVNMALQKNPALQIVPGWLSKIAIRSDGKQAMMSIRCSPEDIQNLDLEKLTGPQAKKADARGEEDKPKPAAVPPKTGRS